jgi:hypothetical protein
MHLPSDAVSHELADDAVSLSLRACLHRVADVRQSIAGKHLCDAKSRADCRIDQSPARIDLADRDVTARRR